MEPVIGFLALAFVVGLVVLAYRAARRGWDARRETFLDYGALAWWTLTAPLRAAWPLVAAACALWAGWIISRPENLLWPPAWFVAVLVPGGAYWVLTGRAVQGRALRVISASPSPSADPAI